MQNPLGREARALVSFLSFLWRDLPALEAPLLPRSPLD